MRSLFIFIFICFYFQSVFGQTKERDSILNLIETYTNAGDFKNRRRVITEAEKQVNGNSSADSLFKASLLFYKSERYKDLLEERKAYEKAIKMCPSTDKGDSLKASLYFKIAIGESFRGFNIIAYNNMKKSTSILENIEKPNQTLLLRQYIALANFSLDFGEVEYHKNHIKKAEKIFNNSDFNPDVILQLEYLYLNIFFLSKGEIYEDKILNYLEEIKKLEKEKDKSVTYNNYRLAHAQVHIAQFYLRQFQKSHDSNLKKKIYKHIDNIQNLSKDDSVMHYYIKMAWHIKNELLLSEGKLLEAFKSNTQLIAISKPKETRMALNLEQRIRLLLRLNRVKEAQKEIYKMTSIFHVGAEDLKEDFSNFKSFQRLDYVSIFLNLSDSFKKYGGSSSAIKKVIIQLNKLALSQFESSIENKLTTPKVRKLFERIIGNLISIKDTGKRYGMTTPELLGTIENIENTLDWQEFLQNREATEFSFFENYKYEEANIRKQLVKARKQKEDSIVLTLELKLELLQENFKEQYPNHSKLAFSDFKINDFQNKLENNEIVLRYENIEESLFVFVIDKNDVQLISLGASKDIAEQVNTYVLDISKGIDNEDISKKLYKQLIPRKIRSFEHLNIVPDNYLFKLPFETLKGDTNSYLIEDKTVIYSPYLSLLQQNNVTDTENRQDSNLVIFTPSYEGVSDAPEEELTRGNEYRLIGAKKESELLADLFDNATYEDYSATKENFKKYAPNAKLLHLSMHANVDAITPELSYLLFTEGNTDNKLYIEELYGMNLKADMAVLSACNTGDGTLDVKKGMISLHTAFTQAGVPTTVASLWSVPDNATQEIMVAFYKELKAGKTKAKALQLAKLNYLKSTDDASFKVPFYWAGFVVNGNNDPVIFTNFKINYMLWGAIGSVFVFIILIWFLKKRREKYN